MQPLPRNFLTRLAHEYDLSPEQEEAFVAQFSSQENSNAFLVDFYGRCR
ncbi:MAG: hypothetical protein F6K41_25370 [Symploca sp. SIO3E6]|nr:hypothetical protein [Caldora sp. SIO3E6]